MKLITIGRAYVLDAVGELEDNELTNVLILNYDCARNY